MTSESSAAAQAGFSGSQPTSNHGISREYSIDNVVEDTRKLIEQMAQSLVDRPNEVRVEVVQGEQAVVIKLSTAPEDVGKVIGKQGRTARSMRTILGAMGMKLKKHFTLEVLE